MVDLRSVFCNPQLRNISDFCNGKNHPWKISYRRYRRGKGRCGNCGARLGKVKVRFQRSHRNTLIENLNRATPLFSLLKTYA